MNEVEQRIKNIKTAYKFSENDEIDDSWSQAKQRAYGWLCALMWIRDHFDFQYRETETSVRPRE